MVGKTSNSATKQPIPQEAFDWYDEYAHGKIDRREFLNRLAGLAVLGFSVATLTEALLPDYAKAEQVSFNDPHIKASYQTFPSPKGHGEGKGYLVVPTQLTAPLPVVLVVHENRGLNPYIQDVARRLAKQGFVAFAPDALAPVGGYPGNDDQGRELQKNLDRAKIEQDFIAAAQYLKTHTLSNGKLGAVGFCFGGYVVNMLAAVMGEQLNAGVPFYGTPAEKSLRADIKAPLQLHFAELDQRVNATWPDYEQDLKAMNARYNAFLYPKVNHGFHNDSTARYAPEEAELAWQRTVEFFRRELKS
ncbi:dienelactone hydrolase family protein [Vibrio vulnificus]|uniref:dienelactone hydrolase family protein n=1 Tax=Vibrio vulnificus TaxID=672 RepID=UPI0002FFDCC9|nr:dienelactone hydrolase family protein [Vibrio vulnificus]ASM98816.1 dienelactone hydrolase [Vibrio vulnificus NBRC 15645 = ATCC 27562]EJE8733471.1 dienelactone hydrolase family protein [Vibrio vulnificus]EKA7348989.1 dienelactone hydrolase family protein [Vibrio vulnificus]MCL7017013.1 dienelactone hydrolase family protein [Vibrio vulnificus]MCU8217664.1 dienelactone hydrolase family protein [Vibrio vulnificus]